MYINRVLVVDDVPGVADSIAYILNKAGYDARAARDGKTSLEMAEAMKPDMVVLDISLPDMSGYELARRLRQSGQKPAPFIIAASGRSVEEHEESDERFLIDEYLEKPVDLKKLKSLLAAKLRA
jgi:DNA-binding response OmpR family regulator